jgi:hypothetical protein
VDWVTDWDAVDTHRLCCWMDSEAMWSDFLSIDSLS